MQNAPFFSIIIPTLNEEKYLPKILSALSKQTFKDFELFVVDGKSEDNTEGVFHQYAQKFGKAQFISSAKRNVSYQRNIGAEKTKGKYLVFFDADVNMEDTYLEELHVAALKRKFPFATTWIIPDSKKHIDLMITLFCNFEIELANVISKPFAGGWNMIVDRDVFFALQGFREDIKIGEDHEFTMRAEKKQIKLTVLKEPRIIWSMRRFRSEGRLEVIRKLMKAQIYTLWKGPITEKIFAYPMGGHVHQKKKRKVNLVELDKYISHIEKIQKRIATMLFE